MRAGRLASWDSAPSVDGWLRWRGAIGMECIAFDPYVVDPPQGVCLKDVDEVLASSDFVAIHAPLTSETEGLIDAHSSRS